MQIIWKKEIKSLNSLVSAYGGEYNIIATYFLPDADKLLHFKEIYKVLYQHYLTAATYELSLAKAI